MKKRIHDDRHWGLTIQNQNKKTNPSDFNWGLPF